MGKTFFDGPYLEQYMNKKMASLAGELNIGAKIKEMLEKPEVDAMITKALEELGSKPEGTMIMMMGIMPIQLKPLITPFMSSMADDIGPLLGQMFDMKSIMSVEKLRSEIDLLMTEKLLELTPEIVRDPRGGDAKAPGLAHRVGQRLRCAYRPRLHDGGLSVAVELGHPPRSYLRGVRGCV